MSHNRPTKYIKIKIENYVIWIEKFVRKKKQDKISEKNEVKEIEINNLFYKKLKVMTIKKLTK